MKNFKMILKILKNKPIAFLNSYITYQLATMFPLVTGLLMREIFSSYEKGKTDTTVWWFIGFFIAVLLARIVSVYFYSITNATARFVSSSLVRVNLLNKIMEKPGAKALNKSNGDTLNSFREDIGQIEDFITVCFNEFLSVFIFSALSLFVLIKINYKITLLVFSPLISVIIIVRMTGNRITKYRKDNRKATGVVSSALGEMFTNIQAIKVYGSEESMKENFKKLNTAREKFAIRDNMFTQLLMSIYENILSIGTGMILIVVSFSIKEEKFNLGDFTIFIYYMNFISSFIQYFGNVMTKYKHTAVAIKSISDISEGINRENLVENTPLYIKEEIPEIQENNLEDGDKLTALSTENLTYLYPETGGGIENISLNVEKNTFTVVTGRVGSGKTTLLRTLLGLLKPQDGNVYWNNNLINKPDEFFIPPRIAYSPQIPHFFSTTVEENILLGKDKNKSDINNAIYLAVMEKDIENIQNGIHTVIGTNGVKLSGGQQQRLSAARMFVRDAELFVFDDISSALDVETEEALWTRLFEKENATCIAVSNRRGALKRADNIILLKDGKVMAQGKLDELLGNNEEMKLIWGESI